MKCPKCKVDIVSVDSFCEECIDRLANSKEMESDLDLKQIKKSILENKNIKFPKIEKTISNFKEKLQGKDSTEPEVFDAVEELGLTLKAKKVELGIFEKEIKKNLHSAKLATESLNEVSFSKELESQPTRAINTGTAQIEEEIVDKLIDIISDTDDEPAETQEEQHELSEEIFALVSENKKEVKKKFSEEDLLESIKALDKEAATLKRKKSIDNNVSAIIESIKPEEFESLFQEAELELTIKEQTPKTKKSKKTKSKNDKLIKAPLSKRFLSGAIDSFITIIISMLVALIFTDYKKFLAYENLSINYLSSEFAYFLIYFFIFTLCFSIVTNAFSDQTFGEKVFSLQKVSNKNTNITIKQIFLRSLLKYTSFLTLAIGYLPIFGKDKESLHNHLSKTKLTLIELE